MMEKIISDYRRFFLPTIVKYWVMTALMAIGMGLAAYANRKLIIPAVVLSGYFAVMSIIGTADIALREPHRFKEMLLELPENERSKIAAEYEKAAKFHCKRFLEEYVLFYLKRRIMLVRYDEIESAEAKGFKIWLRLSGGRMTAVPLFPSENPAVIVAVLRAKNPDISVLINGKVVESMEKRKKE